MAKTSDDDDGEVSGAEIALPLERLSRLMRAAEHDHGLNPAQWEALRFIARANRFSNSPGALTRYLGATKGTISQTVIALERKGFITKTVRADEKRSVQLVLSAMGQEALHKDPWRALAKAIDGLGGKTRRRMAKGLKELLDGQLQAGGHLTFGTCQTCRYFREKSSSGASCMKFEVALSPGDTGLLCVEHVARG